MIVQRLREIQNRCGYLPDRELRQLADESGVPLYRIEEVASFFPAFRQERDKPAFLEVKVCRDYTCHLAGAGDMLADDGNLKRLAAKLSKQVGKEVRVEGVSCLGRCDRAPAVWVERHDHDHSHAHAHEHNGHAGHDHAHDHDHAEHAWVYCGRTEDEMAQLVTTLADARQPRPEPDTDAAYEPHTDTTVRFALPVLLPREKPARAPIPAPLWQIDPYAIDKKPREYRAVRELAEFIKDRTKAGKTPIPDPADVPEKADEKQLDTWIKEQFAPLSKLQAAELQGMGGAGMLAYKKWRDVWREDHWPEGSDKKDAAKRLDKYIVCNGDESEPGTFKDREILLRTPHLVVEGMILAGLITGATAGYVYIRHEYLEQIAAVRAEVERAAKLGACGENVFGTGIAFPVDVFESPGGYICGEQSALIEAMEDRRGQPRNRPPELLTNGLRDKPTVVNNVETLAWTPFVMIRGGKAYADAGWAVPDNKKTEKFAGKKLAFAGRRLFSISGDVNRPGVFEVPTGIQFRELLENPKYCNGVTGKRELKAVAPSGPSGGLMPAKIPVKIPPENEYEKWLDGAVSKLRSQGEKDFMSWFVRRYLPPGARYLDFRLIPMDLGFFRNINTVFRLPAEAMLGAGLAVYADGADMLEHAVNFTRFYRNESCGKCVPCRIGSQKLFQLGTDLLDKRDAGKLGKAEVFGVAKDDPHTVAADVKTLNDVLQQTSICGLGYVAPIPLQTAMVYFPNDVLRKPAPVPPKG